MSGGSFNYISVWAGDLSELVKRSHDLREMAESLEADFPDSAAARDTRRVSDQVTRLACGDHPESQALANVWHEVEWWHSGDRGRDAAQKAVDEYALRAVEHRRFMSWYQPEGSDG